MPKNIPYAEHASEVRKVLILNDILQGKTSIPANSIVRTKGTKPLAFQTKRLGNCNEVEVAQLQLCHGLYNELRSSIWENKAGRIVFHVKMGRRDDPQVQGWTPTYVLADVPDDLHISPDLMVSFLSRLPQFPGIAWSHNKQVGVAHDAFRQKWFMDNVTDCLDPMMFMKFDSEVSEDTWVFQRCINE
ncbi:hypothetical protein BJY04DRAFT_214765 [Aspergillus karnatakaensis]|uniref:uncharacterized protein n=1 Tax=Aspergillus karnatakaensis TaxID=1810916 RepID=UPI003CCD2EAA